MSEVTDGLYLITPMCKPAGYCRTLSVHLKPIFRIAIIIRNIFLLAKKGPVVDAGKLQTHPSRNPTLTVTSYLGQNVRLRRGEVGAKDSFPGPSPEG